MTSFSSLDCSDMESPADCPIRSAAEIVGISPECLTALSDTALADYRLAWYRLSLHTNASAADAVVHALAAAIVEMHRRQALH